MLAPGSSPLARGGRAASRAGGTVRGLIPARAGRTPHRGAFLTRAWAHPRSRGADAAVTKVEIYLWGSSPLARGGHGLRAVKNSRPGLIPARAGRTTTATLIGKGSRAHPRSRGADDVVGSSVDPGAGSSPLARGGQR